MSVKYGLLGLLARQAQHGYELKRTFEQLTGGIWELNHGQIYQSLDRLSADGYVSYTVEQDENAPERKVYDVTERGRAELRRWLERPEVRVRPLRDALFIRLMVMAASPTAELQELIDGYRQVYAQRMRELTRSKNEAVSAEQAATRSTGLGSSGSDELAVEQLLLDAAIFHCEADLRWLDHCEAVLAARRQAAAS